MDLTPHRALLRELAATSGEFLRGHWGQPGLAVETKADASPVTAADRGAEQLMRARIAQAFPSHGILGEEFGTENEGADFTWVLGCIHQPVLGQLMLGDGHTTTLNDRPVRCRAVSGLEAATVLTSDPLNPERYQPGSGYEQLIRRARLVRTWGDCYGYLLVAGGWADVMLDPVMNPWDIAALVPILRGAGGVITDWQGGPAYPASSTVAAATPELHAATLAVLHGQDASKVIRRD